MKRESTDYIVVHCSATKPSQDVGVNEIRQWHLDRGWSDIGYHFVIRRDGTVENGRPLSNMGAHVRGYNRVSIGICLIGGMGDDGRPDCNFTHDQFAQLSAILNQLTEQYPHAVVQGHRDFPGVAKACPCFDVGAWWQE